MDTYKLTFINKSLEENVQILEFTSEDIKSFEVDILNKFSLDKNLFYEDYYDKTKFLIKASFIEKSDNYSKIIDFLTNINTFNEIQEVLVEKNENYLFSFKNIINIHINNVVSNNNFDLEIWEGV